MKKLYVHMPAGEYYGWAICGKNLITNMAKLSDNVRYIPDDAFKQVARDYVTDELIKNITESPDGQDFNTLQTIDNVTPMKYKGSKNVGYMFWEEETLSDYLVEQLKAYDIVATGSTWNTEVVKSYGFEKAVTIHQGVDCALFKPMDKNYFKDKFVIFSGGKLEHRKAQDIVAYVVGQMQKKHNDVYLIASWGNVFSKPEDNKAMYKKIQQHLVPTQTMIIDIMPQIDLISYIAETDIGFFPNRSEGGTNLVMMEYMACGKPVIANYDRGQKDVLSPDYAICLSGQPEYAMIEAYSLALEKAYENRDTLKPMGVKAREAMQSFTWQKTAEEFLKLYEQ